MWLTSNVGRAIGKAGGGSGRGDARRANGVIKFRLFCDRARQSFCKARYWIVDFLTQNMSMIQ